MEGEMSEGEDIWMEIVRIHEADKAKPLNQVDGLWRRELADGWSIAVNGHDHAILDSPNTEYTLPPYHGIAVHGGLPYLVFGPPGTGGVAIGAGSEDAFWEALRKS
jgi:hypothetical protein